MLEASFETISRRCERRLHAERRLRGDGLRDGDRLLEMLAARRDLLDEPDAQRLFCAELVAGQEPAHRVAPARRLHPAEGRAAEREDAALHLDLRELRVVGGDGDVGREHELDAEREAAAVHGAHDRLGPRRAVEAERIDRALGGEQPLALHDHRRDLREIEAGGEVLTVREEHAAAQRPLLELGVRRGQLLEHLRVERVELRRPIEPDERARARAPRW